MKHTLPPIDNVPRILRGLHSEFGDVIDFIWKAPSFIHLQTRIERRKIREFPRGPLRVLPRRLETRKLTSVFPHRLATGNLLVLLSIFEAYMRRLALVAERHDGTRPATSGEQGLNRWYHILRETGVDTMSLPTSRVVHAATMFRDCLIHADGALSHARKENEIRRVVANRDYLLKEHLALESYLGEGSLVAVGRSPWGDCLRISNTYAWLTAFYCREYLESVANALVGIVNRTRRRQN